MVTMNISIREVESKKRILEEAVDTLNEEIAGLKAKGNSAMVHRFCDRRIVSSVKRHICDIFGTLIVTLRVLSL